MVSALDAGLIGRKTALQELKAGSEIDGAWSSITEDMIEEADEEPPIPSELDGGSIGDPIHIPSDETPKRSMSEEVEAGME